MEFLKVRKKPVQVEAFQLTKEIWNLMSTNNITSVKINNREIKLGNKGNAYFTIETLEGEMRANISDWLIKGINGEIYPCKPDIFEKTYEVLNG